MVFCRFYGDSQLPGNLGDLHSVHFAHEKNFTLSVGQCADYLFNELEK